MNCPKCSEVTIKWGQRFGKQRYKCRTCGYEFAESIEDYNLLVIPDTHIPFAHKNAIPFLKETQEEYGCTKVVHVGDIVDMYAVSRYLKSPSSDSAERELENTISALKPWVQAFPELVITIGNHDLRFVKRAHEGSIPTRMLKSVNEIYELPDTWEFKNRHEINNIMFMHGDRSGVYAHVNIAKDLRKSCVTGHTHSSGGVHYMSAIDSVIFALNVGCLIDDKAYAFAYAGEMTRRPVLGCGVIKSILTKPTPIFVGM